MKREQFDEFIKNACGAVGIMTKYLDADDRDVDAELSNAPAAKIKMAVNGDLETFQSYFEGMDEAVSTSC